MINTATTIIPLKTLVGDLYGEESPRSSEFCSVFPLTKSARCDLIITEKERREEKRREERRAFCFAGEMRVTDTSWSSGNSWDE